jgi:hypothetical protein
MAAVIWPSAVALRSVAALFASPVRSPGCPSRNVFPNVPFSPLPELSAAVVPLVSPSRQYPTGASALTTST